MSECKHEKWLYVPTSVEVCDGYLFVDDKNFLCEDCGEWIPLGTIEIDRIVNVVHLPRTECSHDLSYYTISGSWLCLRCGYRWIPTPTPLDVKSSSINWEEEDKKRREKALEKFKKFKFLY